MKNYIVLLGIILLSISLVQAQYDWRMYGNIYTPMFQSQFEGATSRFESGILQINNTLNGISYSGLVVNEPFQPIATVLNNTGFIIFPNGNYLQIFDKDLNFLNEIYVGRQLTQIDVSDFLNDGVSNDISTIIEINSSLSSFRTYSLDINNYSLTKIYEHNFSGDGNQTYGGLRHSGNNIYFLDHYQFDGNYSVNFVIINYSSVTEIGLPNTSYVFREPLSWTDINNDGINEFLTFSNCDVIIFDINGNVEFNYTGCQYNPNVQITDAKIFYPDSSPIWKIIIVREYSGGDGNYPRKLYVDVYKPDKTSYWNKIFPFTSTGGVWTSGGFAWGKIALADYDGDYFPDIYLAGLDTTLNPSNFEFLVIKGNNGNILTEYNFTRNYGTSQPPILAELRNTPSLTISKLTDDNYYEFIFATSRGNVFIVDPSTEDILYETGVTSDGGHYLYSCIPSDINIDGFQEVICSGNNFIQILFSEETNQNAIIDSVLFSPSTTIQKMTYLNVVVQASDLEDNDIYYIHKCFNSDNWSSESDNPAFNCYYSTTGIFNLTIGVRDYYHSIYNYFSQNIYVTDIGTICGDGKCESGETYISCPIDCPEEIPPTTQAEGGIPIPTKIVDPDNWERGLLPEIYYGTLGFFSFILSPTIVLVFLIFSVLIIITLGMIIKKIFIKVTEIGG